MKTKYYLSTLCLAFITFSLFGQLTEVTDYEKKLSYTEFETVYYSVAKDDLDNISLPDMVKMKELMYEREFEKTINAKGEHKTIIKHLSTKNVYEEWMDEPEVIVIDKDAGTLYTFRGDQVKRIPHAPKYLKLAQKVPNDLLPQFTMPTKEDLDAMIEAGIKVEYMNNGSTKITFGGSQSIYNEKLLYNETNDLNEKGELVHSIRIHYMELPGGELVIKRKRETTVVELDNNIKAEHVFDRLYSDYVYEDITNDAADEIGVQILDIKSITNNSQIIVGYNIFTNSNNVHIIIYSISGKIVRKETLENSGHNQISIQNLTPGIYIINIQSEGKTLNGKFIKL
jgi:hypothetical protein